jgi:hypothetical protein
MEFGSIQETCNIAKDALRILLIHNHTIDVRFRYWAEMWRPPRLLCKMSATNCAAFMFGLLSVARTTAVVQAKQ